MPIHVAVALARRGGSTIQSYARMHVIDPSRQLDHIVSSLASLHEPATGRRPSGRDKTTAVIQNAIGALPLPTLVSDDQGRYVAASDSACALTKYSCEELVGRYVWDLTAGATRSEFEPLWRAFLAQGRQRGTYAIQPRTGGAIEVEYVAQAHILRGFHASVLLPIARPATTGQGSEC